MNKKFKFFDDKDLFFARKLRPLADETKMRKFNGSKIITFCLVGAVSLIPYWIYRNYMSEQIVIQYDINLTRKQEKQEQLSTNKRKQMKKI